MIRLIDWHDGYVTSLKGCLYEHMYWIWWGYDWCVYDKTI